MSVYDSCMSLLKKYGGAAKLVTSTVLNVVAPGSGALVTLVEQAFDKGKDVAQHHWEEKLLEATQANADELQRLGRLFDLLNGDLAQLCDKAAAVHDQANIEDIVRQALASDRTLTDGLGKLDVLVADFACVKVQQRQLLDGQFEMLPIMRRLQSVLPFLEECQQAQADPRQLLMHRQAILLNIQLRQPQLARTAVKQLEAVGKRGNTHLFKAGIALIDHDYPSVQSELGEVVRRHPHDNELVELHRRATVIATGITPRVAPVVSVAHASGSSNPEVGDVLDGWTLEARLGSGGWGQVFKATRGEETAALKIMHARYSQDRDFVARFRAEIAALMRIPRHANLLRYLDFNFERGCWYLVTEYIDGPTLDRHLQNKGPLTAELAQKVFTPVTEGLAQAHAAGIVHRDIKPGNFVFRKSDQKLVLVDFGLAVQNENVGQTKVGGVTLMFGSPEQKSGLPADARGDIYSLAATMSFALLYDKPELRNPIHFDADEIPFSLRAALAKAMETNPRKRYADGREFHAALIRPLSPVLGGEGRGEGDRPRTDAKLPQGTQTPSPPTPLPRVQGRGEQKSVTAAVAPKVGDLITNSLGMKFAWVPPGDSLLGGGGGKPGTTPFKLESGVWCGIYPVTQAEWQQVMGDAPSHFKSNPRYPVESVSWNRVQEFLAKINSRSDGYSYRLPTEQEWEYACRGGPISQDQSKYHYYFAKSKTDLAPNPMDNLSSKQANFDGNYPAGSASKGPYLERPSDIGSYLPNPLGIYDMHGNVWEWTESSSGSARVIRGGSWRRHAGYCAASSRRWYVPGYSSRNVGFRLLAVPSGSQ